MGDLVKMKWPGNGHPGIGLIVADVFTTPIMKEGDTPTAGERERMVLWDSPTWGITRWQDRELEVLSEGG